MYALHGTARRGLLAALAIAMAWLAMPAQAHAQVDVGGGVFNRAGRLIGSFEGTLSDLRLVLVDDDELRAVGRFTGTLTDKAGNVVRKFTNVPLSLPVDLENSGPVGATCDILHLELGPLNLNVLGLIVRLNRVVLDIDAQAGGGLLGDLLCALADGDVLNLEDILDELEDSDLIGRVLDLINDLLP